MIRKPEQQVEDMEQDRVRVGYSSQRPESDIELEESDEKARRTK